uniref:G-protein coupled receptors family 1 profile domain-containing protein n=1 Tax=Callorhinchus milii TaxID=7868 RepID=A0A4W3H4B2_CALMI
MFTQVLSQPLPNKGFTAITEPYSVLINYSSITQIIVLIEHVLIDTMNKAVLIKGCVASYVHVYLLFPVNLVAIVILSRGKCALSRCISCYLVAMAASDLLVVLFDAILTRMNFLYFPICFLDMTPVCALVTCLLVGATDSSAWLTVVFTFDRCVAINYQGLKTRYCTEKTAMKVISIVWGISCVKNIPLFFMYEPWFTTNNVPWFCKTKAFFYKSSWWKALNWFYTILTPGVAFFLILLLNILTVRKILVANRVRRELISHNGEKGSDQEMENRRKSIILLFTVSISFMILWATYVVYFIYMQITNHSYTGYNDPVYILYECGIMLHILSSATNTFIYAVTQRKFREEVTNVIKYPFQLIYRLVT